MCVKDEDGVLRPLAGLWPAGKMFEFYKTDIDKYMKRGKKQGLKIVEVKLEEIKK